MTIHPAFRVAGHLIRRAFQAHDAVFARETAGFDITSPQVATLMAIALRPGIELTPLADWVGYDAATLSGLINRLIAKRLVRRVVGTHDRRTRQLFLTGTGQALLDAVTPHAARVTDVLLAPLDAAEREVFFGFMERIVTHAASIAANADTEVA
jgi:DNA-binding MarR family transcriptional regulator